MPRRAPVELVRVFIALSVAAIAGGMTAVFAEDVPDRVQGNWVGEWKLDNGGGGGKQTAQVVALGKGEYQAAFTAYDGSEMQSETFRFLISGSLVDGKGQFSTQINLGDKLGTFDWKAEIAKDMLLGTFTNRKNYIGTLTLKRADLKPDGVGAKPLDGAEVLFDGKNLDRWTTADGKPTAWKLMDGALQVARASDDEKTARHLVLRESLGSMQLHLEYRTPYLPEARGQERGNSGVFLQGRYEIQIVDSFGQPRERNNFGDLSDDDSAGAIFKYAPPTENVTLPPGEWQSLDITFIPAVPDAKGKAEKSAEISVVHNGKPIHERQKVHKPTDGAPVRDLTSKSPGLILEDGGQAVEFRNIWVVRLDPAK
ncbi:MAG: DUF1080 domain-containing protein [Planctomycetaceae bacterium]|nr:DUF1080 domain-containing protein [Planctomycetaceae bacterium]